MVMCRFVGQLWQRKKLLLKINDNYDDGNNYMITLAIILYNFVY